MKPASVKNQAEADSAATGIKAKELSVALVPDRFGAYRYSIFKRLSDYKNNGFKLTVYADTKEDLPGLKLVNPAYCDLDYANGGIAWVRVRNHTFKRICFWQSGLLKMALCGGHQVHVYWGEAHRISTWASALLSRLRGKKVVFWTHGVYGNESPFKGFVRRRFYHLANALLLYGDYAKQLLVKNGFKEQQLYVIKNSLDVEQQNALYDQSHDKAQELKAGLFPDGGKVLLFVGRLTPQKRLGILVDLLKSLHDKGRKDYKLLFIGDGSERAALSAQAASLGLDKDVVFYGACYDEAVLAPLIMMADVCVAPGEVGLTAMHSLVFGTPVVTHDNFAMQMPEFEAIVAGVSGDFYRYGDFEDLCTKVETVLQSVATGQITPERCRENILKFYNVEYQYSVFKRMLEDLQSK